MQVYLPIAELSVNGLMILAMGGGVGILSGMFGVGGGFLMTPLLIFAGIPPTVAVATEANQLVASSLSGTLAHWRKGGVDVKMGLVLLAGGVVGSLLGILLFGELRETGQVDLFISLCYVVLLGLIGVLMMVDSLRASGIIGNAERRRPRAHHLWISGLPFKLRFRRSRLYISALLPLALGCLVGFLASIMGVGGGFIMVPVMIYIIRMPTAMVVGTSLFQIVFVTAFVTFLHAAINQTVDLVLALLLLLGGVFGAQIGAVYGRRLSGESLRFLLAGLVLFVCLVLLFSLVYRPDDLFSLQRLP